MIKIYYLLLLLCSSTLVASTFYQGFNVTDNSRVFSTGFGDSVKGIGDVNGDGYEDLLITAPNGCSEQNGCAYIIFGGPTSSLVNLNTTTMKATQGITIMTSEDSANLGNFAASAGDLNGDGYDDIILTSQNIIYVLFGSKNPSNINVTSMTSQQGVKLRCSLCADTPVSSAGDINADGYPDLMVSVTTDGAPTGVVYVVFGGATLSDLNLTTLTSSQGFNITGIPPLAGYGGITINSAGDVNGDKIGDILITSIPFGEKMKPSVYVVYGRKSISSFNLTTINSTLGCRIQFGSACKFGMVTAAADINKDGYSDIFIPAYGLNQVYVVFGGASLADIPDVASMSTDQGFSIGYYAVDQSIFGSAMSSANDINGDGYQDIIISNPGTIDNAGNLYVIFSQSTFVNIDVTTMDSTQGITIAGAYQDDKNFGASVGSADVNNDGFSDIIIGEQVFEGERPHVYVIFGGPQLGLGRNDDHFIYI